MSAGAQRREGRPPAEPRRKGWCPGALRPMATGDGLLARARTSGGRLNLDQAAGIAEASARCGNGVLCLSARGNLQIRGVSQTTLPDLHARLAMLGLLDSAAEVERLRNIVASPLADADPASLGDAAPLVAALEARLERDETLRGLPPKFGFVIDAGGRLPLGEVEADIRFEPAPQFAGAAFAARLGGDVELAAPVAPERVADVAAALAGAFLRLAARLPEPPRRMRALVAPLGAGAVFAEAGVAAQAAPRVARRAALADALGVHDFGGGAFVGAAAAFGTIAAADFAKLVAAAREAGASGLRLTPWRAMLAVGLGAGRAAALADAARRCGFIVEPGDPRLRIVACPGAPACLHAAQPTLPLAARLAPLLAAGDGVALHISGCQKGCAREAAAPLTFVARDNGFDVVVGGRADAAPWRRGLGDAAMAALVAGRGAAEDIEGRSGL